MNQQNDTTLRPWHCGAVECRICGLKFLPELEEDRQLHELEHIRMLRGGLTYDLREFIKRAAWEAAEYQDGVRDENDRRQQETAKRAVALSYWAQAVCSAISEDDFEPYMAATIAFIDATIANDEEKIEEANDALAEWEYTVEGEDDERCTIIPLPLPLLDPGPLAHLTVPLAHPMGEGSGERASRERGEGSRERVVLRRSCPPSPIPQPNETTIVPKGGGVVECRICGLIFFQHLAEDRESHEQRHRTILAGGWPYDVREFIKRAARDVLRPKQELADKSPTREQEIAKRAIVFAWWARAVSKGIPENDLEAYFAAHLASKDAQQSGDKYQIEVANLAMAQWQKYG